MTQASKTAKFYILFPANVDRNSDTTVVCFHHSLDTSAFFISNLIGALVITFTWLCLKFCQEGKLFIKIQIKVCHNNCNIFILTGFVLTHTHTHTGDHRHGKNANDRINKL